MIVQMNLANTTTLLGLTTTIDETIDTVDSKTTTVLALSASLSTVVSPENSVYAESAQRYVDSLSDTQLVQMIDELSAREKEIDRDLLEVRVLEDRTDGGRDILHFELLDDQPKVLTKSYDESSAYDKTVYYPMEDDCGCE